MNILQIKKLYPGSTYLFVLLLLIMTSFLSACVQQPVFDDTAESADKYKKSSKQHKSTEVQAGCSLVINPGDSFENAFAHLSYGDILCLNDGEYHQMMDIPDNISVKAVHDGKAVIDGRGKLGTPWKGGLLQMTGNGSSVRGIRVHHAGKNSHTCFISGSNNSMQVMSCSHAGKQKHKVPLFMTGTGHLIEDSWFYGKGRYIVQCFIGKDIIIRRNVARWDMTTPNTPSEPNAAFSIYNCANITIENNISIDYGHSEQYMKFGADFYSPQNCKVFPEGNNNNYYLGNYAINHAKGNANRKGLRFEADCTSKNNVVEDFYVRHSDYGIVTSGKETGLQLNNCTFIDVIKKDVSGSGSNSNVICGGVADLGAKYINRIKVSHDLFPWKNEDLIKNDFCRRGERQSDWCKTDKTLTEYVLNVK